MPPAERLTTGLLVHGAALCLGGLLLVAVCQPIFTDDFWWHAALGRAFLREGPWLAEDPLLFAAAGPPSAASWLHDVALQAALRTLDFEGLRVLHGVAVAGIVALAWSALQRASRSPLFSSAATGVFVILAAYRLVQLRPHLFTVFAILLLYRWLVENERPPSLRRVAAAGVVFALWANVHAGFVLGLAVLGAAVCGLALAAASVRATPRTQIVPRLRRLGLATAVGALATLANPGGIAPHRAYLIAGVETPSLSRVGDEWAGLDPTSLPASPLPPSVLDWSLWWLLLLATAGLAVLCRKRAPGDPHPADRPDPALAAAAVLGLAAPLFAVRFAWLGILPLLLLARTVRGRRPSRALRWAGTGGAVVLVPAFLLLGAWPGITRALPPTWDGYREPYSAVKYFGHATWFLRDAGLEGNLFNDYFQGGFLGFWLAPPVRQLLNGSLNVSTETLDAARRIRERTGGDMVALLERYRVDLFFGIRLPEVGPSQRHWQSTTAHLEGVEGWVPIFRNLRSAIYLRRDARNRANLDRVAAYYARQGVPFHPTRGFEVEPVIRQVPDWAAAHGIVPRRFRELVAWSLGRDLRRRQNARDLLASVYATLGLYELSSDLDRRLLATDPGSPRARRRLVWSLLRAGRCAAAREAADRLGTGSRVDPLAIPIRDLARQCGDLAPDAWAARAARLPVFTREEAAWVLRDFVPPRARRVGSQREGQPERSSRSM